MKNEIRQGSRDWSRNLWSRVVAIASGLDTRIEVLEDDGYESHVHLDTTANWNVQTSYVPDRGDVIVYTDHSTVTVGGTAKPVPGIKIGDGNAYVVDLPFIDDAVMQALMTHVEDSDRHITAAERTFWNNKLNCTTSNETLILNRL